MNEQKRAILAIVLAALVMVVWQMTFGTQMGEDIARSESHAVNNYDSSSTNYSYSKREGHDQNNSMSLDKNFTSSNIEKSDESFIIIENDLVSYSVSNYLSITGLMQKIGTQSEASKKFQNSYYQDYLFESHINGVFKPIKFEVNKVHDQAYRFISDTVSVTLSLDRSSLLSLEFSSTKVFRYQIRKHLNENQEDSGNMLAVGMPSSLQLYHYNKKEFLTLDKSDDSLKNEGIIWDGVSVNHFVFVNIYNGLQVFTVQKQEDVYLTTYTLKNPQKLFRQKILFSKKDYDNLKNEKVFDQNNNLHLIVDFGMLSLLAVPILNGLHLFYDFIPNYGIAIILLTLLMRMLTFPLQVSSFKSMKKMQEIQPQLQSLREKFKDNPQKLQQETMIIMKNSGANPIGGCLPLFLQMPIFFAFYKVLYSSVDLVGAPFALWIHDLSQKDPYYLLPLLMALAMFLNQKLSPSTISDPAQKKVMLILPVVFAFIMKDFPAGMTLYITVSTFAGIAQQMYVNKSK